MKLCERESCRKTHKGEVSEEIRNCCNQVKCTSHDGTVCECWMEYPEDQPYHDKDATIEINERVDQHQDMTYYGLSAMLMGGAGIVLFLLLWAKEVGVF